MPMLWGLYSPTHSSAAMAASTADPRRFKMSLRHKHDFWLTWFFFYWKVTFKNKHCKMTSLTVCVTEYHPDKRCVLITGTDSIPDIVAWQICFRFYYLLMSPWGFCTLVRNNTFFYKQTKNTNTVKNKHENRVRVRVFSCRVTVPWGQLWVTCVWWGFNIQTLDVITEWSSILYLLEAHDVFRVRSWSLNVKYRFTCMLKKCCKIWNLFCCHSLKVLYLEDTSELKSLNHVLKCYLEFFHFWYR